MADFSLTRMGEMGRGIPVVGDVLKTFGVESEEERKVREAFDEMQKTLQQYRPAAAEARMRGLSNQVGMFGPVNDLLERMYGPSASFDVEGLLQNPAQMLPTSGRTSVGETRDGTPLTQPYDRGRFGAGPRGAPDPYAERPGSTRTNTRF